MCKLTVESNVLSTGATLALSSWTTV